MAITRSQAEAADTASQAQKSRRDLNPITPGKHQGKNKKNRILRAKKKAKQLFLIL